VITATRVVEDNNGSLSRTTQIGQVGFTVFSEQAFRRAAGMIYERCEAAKVCNGGQPPSKGMAASCQR